MKLWPVLTGVAIALTLVACQSPTPPKGVKPITHFDAGRYLGKWYEVARLETALSAGLSRSPPRTVSAATAGSACSIGATIR